MIWILFFDPFGGYDIMFLASHIFLIAPSRAYQTTHTQHTQTNTDNTTQFYFCFQKIDENIIGWTKKVIPFLSTYPQKNYRKFAPSFHTHTFFRCLTLVSNIYRDIFWQFTHTLFHFKHSLNLHKTWKDWRERFLQTHINQTQNNTHTQIHTISHT